MQSEAEKNFTASSPSSLKNRELPSEVGLSLDFSVRRVGEWHDLLRQAPHANWQQSWPYAEATRARDYKLTRIAKICEGQNVIGMVALQEVALGPIHVVNINRGPLWFEEAPKQTRLVSFANLLRSKYPRRWGLRLRWLPEWTYTEAAVTTLLEAGFRDTGATYSTNWIDLRPSVQELRQSLRGNWRNQLNRSLKSSLRIEEDWKGAKLSAFLRSYEAQRQRQSYPGPSAAFLREEFLSAVRNRDGLLLWAMEGESPVAGLMVLVHGGTASYRMGWTTATGRLNHAHNGLLWRALTSLRARGIERFDLGGILPLEAPRLTHFKEGLGGQNHRLLGIFS